MITIEAARWWFLGKGRPCDWEETQGGLPGVLGNLGHWVSDRISDLWGITRWCWSRRILLAPPPRTKLEVDIKRGTAIWNKQLKAAWRRDFWPRTGRNQLRSGRTDGNTKEGGQIHLGLGLRLQHSNGSSPLPVGVKPVAQNRLSGPECQGQDGPPS